jgi:hypothetical protein
MRGPVLASGLLLLAASGATPEPAGEAVLTRVEPCRFVDTRESPAVRQDPTPAYGPPQLRPGVARSFVVAGQCGVPADASAVQLDVVATRSKGRGYLVAYPSNAVGPAAWSLDYGRTGSSVVSAVVVDLGSGGFDLIARGHATDLVVDVVGYVGGSGLARAPGEEVARRRANR